MAARSHRKKARSRSSVKPRAAAREETATSDDQLPTATEGFSELDWHREPNPRPTNRQRALMGISAALLFAWWIVLAWLVWGSLS